MIDRSTKRRTAQRATKRQVHDLRRLTMSSSRRRMSSVPKRLGQGITRRTSRSTSPRKPITTPAVAAIDQPTLKPSWLRNHMKAAGLVSSAISVATRVSRRSCPASASDSSPVRSLPTTCAVAMFSVYPCPFGASFIRMGSHISLRNGFTDEQVERARRYHGPLYLTLAVDLLFAGGVLAV